MTTTRQFLKASELRAGQHIAPSYDVDHDDDHDVALSVAEVRHVEPYTRPDGEPYVLVVIDGAGFYRWPVDDKIPLATADEIRDAANAKKRAEMVAGVRQFLDLIEEHKLPVPQYGVTLGYRLSTAEQLRELADALGIEVVQSGYNMSADWTWPPSADKYTVPTVDVTFTAPLPATAEVPAPPAATTQAGE